MQASDFIRDPKAIHASLVFLPDKRVVTKTKLCIHIPTRYIDLGLATIGVKNSSIGFLAMVNPENRYAIMRIPSIVRMGAAKISRSMIGNRDYTLFYFEPGDVVFESQACVKKSTLVYYVFDELFMNGNVPWFIMYDDMVGAFSSAMRFTGTRVASNRVAVSLLASHLARDPQDKTKFLRHALKTRKDLVTLPVEYIGLNNVQYAPTSTMYRLGGSYMEEAMVTAFNNPSDRVDVVEQILRS